MGGGTIHVRCVIWEELTPNIRIGPEGPSSESKRQKDVALAWQQQGAGQPCLIPFQSIQRLFR